ncbi:MAG: amidohydrolase family protein [Bacteroidia bacterium]|nr:amidohydrolase family protein [Bacteroidia bacterium]
MILSSHRVLRAETGKLEPAVLHLDASGTIREITWGEVTGDAFHGILSPGFVNAHCHLELSHLHGKLNRGRGMAGFISELMPLRNAVPESQRCEAMLDADREMNKNGIVAVGDISNTADSLKLKSQSSIAYHTFIELLDLHPSKTEDAYNKGLALVKLFGTMPASLVPHAPYTVTPELFRKIAEWHRGKNLPCCIHHQESEAENEFFRHRGSLWDFFLKLNMDLSWVPRFNNSLEYIQSCFHVPGIQLVHNTVFRPPFSVQPPLHFLCACPRANLFIENTLPDYTSWWKAGWRVTVGTDSMASNTRLSILEELITIKKSCIQIPFSELLLWATRNGADFLGLSGMYGTLETGKRPGIIHISGMEGENPAGVVSVKRLI